jgi:integrase/recombinase XerD
VITTGRGGIKKRAHAHCRLQVSDFRPGEDPKIRVSEKGERRRTVGVHFRAADLIAAYLEAASIVTGPLFRARASSRSRTEELSDKTISRTAMYELLDGYFARLPSPGEGRRFTPHSLRATTATLLLDSGEEITKVQELLGHRHVTTTQIYDKRRRTSRESASHHIPI